MKKFETEVGSLLFRILVFSDLEFQSSNLR